MVDEDLTVVIACHKSYWVPDDSSYLPVQVGAVGKDPIDGFQRDDQGDNISVKNPSYCELTGLYWAWRNLDSDWLGLSHYRRHFSNGLLSADRRARVASGDYLKSILVNSPAILPIERNYYVETNRSHYIHAHHEADLDAVRESLYDVCPSLIPLWDRRLSMTHAHMFNMLIMRRDLVDEWCNLLFNVLSRVEERLDVTGYSPYDRRVYGFVSELLLDPWIESAGIPYTGLPVVHLESQHWPRKVAAFLSRKAFGHAPADWAQAGRAA